MTEPAPLPPASLRTEARRLYGTDPVAYETGRPDYPERVYEILRGRCELVPLSRVLEIGPGTGRVTRRLLAEGAEVVAVEPDGELAAYLCERVANPRLEVIHGLFEIASIDDGAFDLVVSAMSFHWVDPDIGLPKLGAVIRPGGWAAVWWTVFGDPTREDPFRERARLLLDDGGRSEPAQAFELDVEQRCLDLRSGARLVDVEGELIRWTMEMDSEQTRALYASTIGMLRRPQDEQDRLLDAIVDIAETQFGGRVERPFVTALYTGRRNGI